MIISVIYPNREGASFDLVYYVDTHIKALKETWRPAKVALVHGSASMDGGAPPFAMIAHFEFADRAALDAALGDPRREEFRADVANFTNIAPILMIGAAA